MGVGALGVTSRGRIGRAGAATLTTDGAKLAPGRVTGRIPYQRTVNPRPAEASRRGESALTRVAATVAAPGARPRAVVVVRGPRGVARGGEESRKAGRRVARGRGAARTVGRPLGGRAGPPRLRLPLVPQHRGGLRRLRPDPGVRPAVRSDRSRRTGPSSRTTGGLWTAPRKPSTHGSLNSCRTHRNNGTRTTRDEATRIEQDQDKSVFDPRRSAGFDPASSAFRCSDLYHRHSAPNCTPVTHRSLWRNSGAGRFGAPGGTAGAFGTFVRSTTMSICSPGRMTFDQNRKL